MTMVGPYRDESNGLLLTHGGRPYRITGGRPARGGRISEDIILAEPLAEDLNTAVGGPVELLARDCTPAAIDLMHFARTGERRLYQRRTDG